MYEPCKCINTNTKRKCRTVIQAHHTEVITSCSELLSLHCLRHQLLVALLPALPDLLIIMRQDCTAYAVDPLCHGRPAHYHRRPPLALKRSCHAGSILLRLCFYHVSIMLLYCFCIASVVFHKKFLHWFYNVCALFLYCFCCVSRVVL